MFLDIKRMDVINREEDAVILSLQHVGQYHHGTGFIEYILGKYIF
jgi:hypothetical protein